MSQTVFVCVCVACGWLCGSSTGYQHFTCTQSNKVSRVLVPCTSPTICIVASGLLLFELYIIHGNEKNKINEPTTVCCKTTTHHQTEKKSLISEIVLTKKKKKKYSLNSGRRCTLA